LPNLNWFGLNLAEQFQGSLLHEVKMVESSKEYIFFRINKLMYNLVINTILSVILHTKHY